MCAVAAPCCVGAVGIYVAPLAPEQQDPTRNLIRVGCVVSVLLSVCCSSSLGPGLPCDNNRVRVLPG